MTLSRALVAVPALLMLLTWLLLQGMNPDMQRPVHALKALDDFAIAEGALHRDVLTARAGLLRNYDPLVREMNALNDAVLRLREFGDIDAEKRAAVDRLAGVVRQEEDLVERFKSDNALLQNSLVYFGLYSARLGSTNRSGPLVSAVSALAASMLHLTLDTSSATSTEVATSLESLEAFVPPSADAATTQALLAHGRMLHRLLPATDDVLKSLFALSSKSDQDQLRAMVVTYQQCAEKAARRYGVLLYAMSLLLLAALVHLGLQLHARAQALKRRAEFEHLIAGISTRFINSPPHEIGAQVQQALVQLAQWVGADRAYFACSCAPPRTFTSHALPAGWPQRAMALAAQLGPKHDGLIHVPLVGQLPPGPARDVLEMEGLVGWACVVRLGGDGTESILGFDTVARAIAVPAADLGQLRMALDALANAVDRDCLERERMRLETSLHQARRMETIGALASGIAHNFNNIVGAILGYAEMAEAQLAADSRQARHVMEIRRAGERARFLVDQILAFGRRREPYLRKQICVRTLLAESRSLLAASLPTQIELRMHDVPDTAIVSGEPGQIQQVILNLGNNAAQAMDDSGCIEIETHVREITRAQTLSHGELEPGLYVCIAISDTGRGMDEATLERIFEPFFTTRHAGYGLGLATVGEIVREHGGAMHVRSAPGAGSRFEAWLPCTSVLKPGPDEEPAAQLPLGRGQTVLVVNEDRAGLLRDEEMLAALGYEPVGFIRPADAVVACQVLPHRFDALLIGHLMPLASVLDLAAALHEIVPGLPVVLAAASINEVSAETLAMGRISEVVHRPLVSNEIAAALKRCIAEVQHA